MTSVLVGVSMWEPHTHTDYQGVVADPQLFGGKLAIPRTRRSVALILRVPPERYLSRDEIDSAFDHSFPHEALPEVLKVASELTDSYHAAA
jgi:uncharacterized protein (DUF433 family)